MQIHIHLDQLTDWDFNLLTSDMVDRVESNPKPSNFKRILSFNALLQTLYSLPVLICEARVIGSH